MQHLGARPGADPVAEPGRGRQLRVRGTAAPARAHRAVVGHRDPRSRPLRRRGRSPRGNRIVPCSSTSSTHSRATRFSLALGIEYSLSPDGLTRADDRDEHRRRRLPVRRGRPSVPDARHGERRPADAVHPGSEPCVRSDERGLPTGTEAGRGDGLRLPPVEADRDDEARQRLHRAGARRRRARPRRAARPAPRHRASRSGSTRATRTCCVFTGDPLPDVNRRSLAVEPMTCPPNAFRSGDGADPARARPLGHERVGHRAVGEVTKT